MIVFMLVATLVFQGNASRVVPVAQPFFRTLAECQEQAKRAADAPPIVDEIRCERRQIDMATGRSKIAP
jgi:hypothetical protein